MAVKTSRKPGYEANRQRMRARSRAFHRLAALHRPDFLRLLAEEQRAIDAETAAAARRTEHTAPDGPGAITVELLASELLGTLCPVSAPAEWIREYEMQARGDL